jgi:hypothetical protein
MEFRTIFISKFHNNTKFRTPNKKVVFRSEKYDQNNVK